MRYTNGEIEKAKMFSRRISALRKTSVPPLSRLKSALAILGGVLLHFVVATSRYTWRSLRGKEVCSKCAGRCQLLTHIIHDEFEMRPCRLCSGKGEVTWRENKARRWGESLRCWRIANHLSLAQMHYVCPGVVPGEMSKMEEGLVPVEDWPDKLYEIVAERHAIAADNS